MPDLGKYAFEVGLAYGVSLILLVALVAFYWRKSVVVRRKLQVVEARSEGAK